jgi:ABC-type nitrate/sulfonate/bicarbonate transport system substrate-binding protein
MKLLKVLALGSLVFFLPLRLIWAQDRPLLVNISIPSLSMDQAPYVIAKEKGFFRQEGIEPRFILMHSAIASKALVSKDVDFNTSGSPAVNAAVAGLPIRAVFANGSRTEMYLIGAKGIQSRVDLSGTKGGVGGIGGRAVGGTKRLRKAKGIG